MKTVFTSLTAILCTVNIVNKKEKNERMKCYYICLYNIF